MLSNNYTEKLIDLKGVKVKNIIQSEKITTIEMEMELREQHCPCCGAATRTVHDYRAQPIRDIPAFGKEIILLLRKRRYRCKECNKKFFEQNTFLPRFHRMTNRLSSYVISKLHDTCSFTSVARDIGLSVTTVIRIFDLVEYAPSQLPAVLSIDEFKGNTNKEKYQCIITDPLNHRVLDILPDRQKHHLTSYFKGFDRSSTTFFVSDMWSTYEDISLTYFKNATFIVDKYHFIRQVIWAFEAVRKEEQKKFARDRRIYFKHSRKLLLKSHNSLTNDEKQQINVMLFASEKLLVAYSLKESFFEFMHSKNSQEARPKLSDWVMDAGNSSLHRFATCAKTMSNWSVGILNSFDFPYTNGFTEGANNKIKVLKRNAYGYRNFYRFRNRILHMFSQKNLSKAG